jgi:lipoate-protein ligase A
MAADEALLESVAADGPCTLRFYQWEEPTLSLGYFQTYVDRQQHAASRDAAIVRRASGGGAILHDHELTYSFAVPSRHPLAIDRLRFYQAVHTTLIETLAQWDIATALFAESEQPAIKDKSQPFLCFERRSPGDVVLDGVKIAGSAQRRCRGAVLQHGSILLAQSQAAPELAGLKELTGRTISPTELIEAWLPRLTEALAISLQSGSLSESERRRAETLAAEKYATPFWTERRSRNEVP